MKVKSALVGIGLAVILLTLVTCSLTGAPNIPSFLTSDHISQIIVSNDHTGANGVASQKADDLNVLLNLLNIGGLTTSAREDAAEPTTSAYTLTTYVNTTVVWTLFVLDSPTSSRVYIHDAAHPGNSGIYPLAQPIKSSDLDQFISQNPKR